MSDMEKPAGEPVVVVAMKRGFYNGKTRYEGERFAITDEAAFSKKWMAKPDDPAVQEEVRVLETSYKQTRAREATRDITDEQLLAEIAQSSGVVAALRLENAQLKEDNRALREQLDAAIGGQTREVRGEEGSARRRGSSQAAALAASEPAEAGEGEGEADNGEPGGAGEAAGYGEGDAPGPIRRRR
jgi:hypothetical protein